MEAGQRKSCRNAGNLGHPGPMRVARELNKSWEQCTLGMLLIFVLSFCVYVGTLSVQPLTPGCPCPQAPLLYCCLLHEASAISVGQRSPHFFTALIAVAAPATAVAPACPFPLAAAEAR